MKAILNYLFDPTPQYKSSISLPLPIRYWLGKRPQLKMQTRLLLSISHRYSSGGSPSSPAIHPKPVAGFRRPSRYSHVDIPPRACFFLLLRYSKEGPAYSRARDRRPRRARDGHIARGGMQGDSASPDTFPQCSNYPGRFPNNLLQRGPPISYD